jgi:DNA-binding CsgD family transcriptional regulator
VRLVVEGHTNAEIGERLFVSVHTVKKHLSHVYAKVGLDKRAELAAQAARRDLSPASRPGRGSRWGREK